jgi:DNA/RNA endonuclease YhcR with UshA esterase domain
MHEKTVEKIALIVLIFGLAFLFLYAEDLELKTITSIDELPAEEEVKIGGTITSIRQHEKVSFIQVEGQKVETINILVFDEPNLFLQVGDYVEVEGSVEEYKGKKEVIGNEVVVR